jgi:hypothetical protein
MKPVPFAEYLARHQTTAVPETGPTWPPPRKRSPDEQAARVSPLLRKTETQPQPQPQSPEARPIQTHRLEQSLLKAFEEGRDAARRELDEDRARFKQEMAQDVARERDQWASAEGERLLEAHRAAIADFEMRCAQTVANILRPFLTQAVIARVTESLVQNLEVLFASRTQALFEISGPPDLLEALKTKFADRQATISYLPTDSIDVRVCVDDTIIETQLAAWMQALGALPPDAAQESGS